MDLWLSTLLRSMHWLEKCILHVVLGCKFFPSYYKLMSQPVQAQYLVQLLSQLEECHFTASTGSVFATICELHLTSCPLLFLEVQISSNAGQPQSGFAIQARP